MIASLFLSGLLVTGAPSTPVSAPVRIAAATPGTAPSPAPAAPSAPKAPPGPPASARPGGPGAREGAPKPDTEDPTQRDATVVTSHQITLNGKPFRYTATAGMMPLKNAAGDTEARIFYIAYTADTPKDAQEKSKRPLMFSFNGGPGSSSVWLHLGAIGPRRVDLLENGGMPKPPYRLVDNESTWLDKTDVVFIDPVGTGFSHAVKPEDDRKYWGVREDISSVAEFIRMYLTRNNRWTSPLFLVGESYGTFRAAGLAGYLVDNGIALDGVILISTVLNMGMLSPGQSGDIGYALFLPTYAATAWYHKRLPPDLQQKQLPDVLSEVEGWALSDYVPLLARGTNLAPEARQAAVQRLARYTGLSSDLISDSNLRIEDGVFMRRLLGDNRTVGRYDSRFVGLDEDASRPRPEYDPSYAAVQPPFTMTFNEYVRAELGFATDREYGILVNAFPWNFGRGMPGMEGPPTTSDDLRAALVKNPYMRVLVAEGVYDLATPYFSVEYTLDHMNLTPELRARVGTARFRSGHMIYTDTPARRELKASVAAFLDSALGSAGPAG